MERILLIAIFLVPLAHAEDGVQSVTATQLSSGNVAPIAEISYSSTNINHVPGTTGIGVRVHFDSAILGTPFISDTYQDGLIGVSTQDDEDNLDGDASTDKFILLAWISINGDWGTSTPLTLFRLTGERALVSSSMLRFTAAGVAEGYTFSSKPFRLEP